MASKLNFIAFLFFVVSSAALASEPIVQDEYLSQKVRIAMSKATDYYRSISTNGGYAGIYSLDLKKRYRHAPSEVSRIPSNEIWAQPPGSPRVGLTFLHAYKATLDKKYLSAARDVGLALAWGQCEYGGWGYRADVSNFDVNGISEHKRKQCHATFDNNTSQGVMDFMMSLDEVIDEPWLSETVERGLSFMLEAQYPNGAWPQWWPLKGGLSDYYTFNDGAINDCIKVMIKAHKLYNKKEYLMSAICGGDFIILSQLPSPQAGWAQQYTHDIKPAWGRAFEPTSVCSLVTSRNIRTLVDIYLYTEKEKYLLPVEKAIYWLERSAIEPNKWARLYELGSNKPIYCDKSRKIYYDFDQLDESIRGHYGWQGSFNISAGINYYRKVRRMGFAAYLGRKVSPKSTEELARKANEVEDIVESLDEKGRWVRNNMIYMKDFSSNFKLLSEYLERQGVVNK